MNKREQLVELAIDTRKHKDALVLVVMTPSRKETEARRADLGRCIQNINAVLDDIDRDISRIDFPHPSGEGE